MTKFKRGRRRPVAACAVAIVLTFGTTSCYTMRHEYDGDIVITNATKIPGMTKQVRHFRVHDRNWYLFWGLTKVGGDANGPTLAAKEASPGQAIVNFQLEDGQGAFDAILSNSLGIVGSWSVWAEGDIVERGE